MKHFWRIACLLLITPLIPTVSADPSRTAGLCMPSETAFFACQTAKGKLIDVCGIFPDQLQYRYGTPTRIELTFPSKTTDGPHQFRLSMTANEDDTYTSLDFINSFVNYTVFDYVIYGDQGGGVVANASRVSNRVGISCSGPPVDRLSTWNGQLRCGNADTPGTNKCRSPISSP